MSETAVSTFAHQATLPRLPVPDLLDTMHRYLASVAPLLTPKQFRETCLLAFDFLKTDGPKLQQRLLDRAAEKKDSSWLLDWWRHYSYLAFRASVVINVSYFYQFRDAPRPHAKSQAGRAAELAIGVAAFRDQLAAATLPPDMAGKTPLCMSMYRHLFNTCRVPAPGRDQVYSYEMAAFTDILVIRNNRFFLVDVGGADNRVGLRELTAQLEDVIRRADALGPTPPVGCLTSANRDLWAEALPLLLSSDSNKASFDALASTMFAVCLDSHAPTESVEVARGLLHGDGRNRWYDKSMQFIVFANGKAGMLGEHSLSDGMPTAAACDWILTGLDKGTIDLSGKSSSSRVGPRHLPFDLSDPVVRYIHKAEAEFDALVADHEVSSLAFKAYGRNAIKSYKCPPDAFTQMAIQLAYFRTFGKLRATYEPAHTRKFLHGRTTTIRSVSIQAEEWVAAMQDPAVGAEAKKKLLSAATTQHVKLTKEALNGQDVDRHLFGLKMLVKDGEAMPSLFKDDAYGASCHWAISTSNLSSQHFDNWGWGEVVSDGIGVAYSTLKDRLQFNVTARKGTGADAFVRNLELALAEMSEMCETAKASSSSSSKGRGASSKAKSTSALLPRLSKL